MYTNIVNKITTLWYEILFDLTSTVGHYPIIWLNINTSMSIYNTQFWILTLESVTNALKTPLHFLSVSSFLYPFDMKTSIVYEPVHVKHSLLSCRISHIQRSES